MAEGIDPDAAREAATAAAGDLGRARLLATDDRLVLRRDAWAARARRSSTAPARPPPAWSTSCSP